MASAEARAVLHVQQPAVVMSYRAVKFVKFKTHPKDALVFYTVTIVDEKYSRPQRFLQYLLL
jgi:hypothetical protein